MEESMERHEGQLARTPPSGSVEALVLYLHWTIAVLFGVGTTTLTVAAVYMSKMDEQFGYDAVNLIRATILVSIVGWLLTLVAFSRHLRLRETLGLNE